MLAAAAVLTMIVVNYSLIVVNYAEESQGQGSGIIARGLSAHVS